MNKLYVALVFLAMTSGEVFAGKTYRNSGYDQRGRENALKKEAQKYSADRYGASAVVPQLSVSAGVETSRKKRKKALVAVAAGIQNVTPVTK